jgi:hypothetical protein
MMYYRIIEWCGQYRLATEYGIAVDIEGEAKLRDTSPLGQARYSTMFSGEHADKRGNFVSLKMGYELLAAVDDPLLGKAVYANLFGAGEAGDRIASKLQARNQCIFAHGYVSVSEKSFLDIKAAAVSVLLAMTSSAVPQGKADGALFNECAMDQEWMDLTGLLDAINVVQGDAFDMVTLSTETMRERMRTLSSGPTSEPTSREGSTGSLNVEDIVSLAPSVASAADGTDCADRTMPTQSEDDEQSDRVPPLTALLTAPFDPRTTFKKSASSAFFALVLADMPVVHADVAGDVIKALQSLVTNVYAATAPLKFRMQTKFPLQQQVWSLVRLVPSLIVSSRML